MLPIRILFSPYMLPFLVLASGGVVFKLSSPECGRIPENAQIFVLTGDARRIPFALEKLDGHPNRRLYVIGAGTPTLDTRFQSQIEIENRSKSTYENAVAIKRIVRDKLMSDIVVITTVDHINRAAFLIKRQIPYVRIRSCPAPLNGMPAAKRLERWAAEYVKFIGTLLGIYQRA